MSNFKISPHNTSNTKILKFEANQFIIEHGSYEYSNIDEAKNSPLAQQLFYLPFVKKVYISGNFIAIERYDIVEWDEIKNDLIALLTKLKAEGKKVVAYGATSKSTTVTNYFGITPDLVECIYDTTPIKQNKYSPGVHIPVLPYEQFHESNPDYVLLFAWNHAIEIMKKEKD